MTATATIFSAPALSRPARRALRVLGLCLTLLVFAAGWASILAQQGLLWQRLPADAAERFVADQVSAPLPARPGAALLLRACARAGLAGRVAAGLAECGHG